MKVYAIEKGWYSDRHIIGIVETEDEAKSIVDAIKGGSYDSDSARYEEYDTKKFQKNRMRFTEDHEYNDSWHAEYDEYGWNNEFKDNTEVYEGHYVIYADTSEQAKKIAQDMYWEEKARREGLV